MRLRYLPAILGVLIPASLWAEEISAKHLEFFEKKIRPVLVEKCYQCHAEDAEKIKGDLLLDTREGSLRGGENGPAVVPGDLEKSLLVAAIRYADPDLEMPPKERLSESVVADFEKWIAMGAPDPRKGGEGAGLTVKSEIDFEGGRRYWAFQKPVEPAAPKLKDERWPRTEADALLLSRLEQEGLKPAGDADRQTLVRRLYFDLIGLPPSPGQVEAFLADTSGEAVEKVVDELLASSHYGERWGRHWMDVARYAESTGMERNFAYPAAWRYRDYVIDSFNQDKPYDRFILEQVAGDLLPAESKAERDRLTVATGFLAMGPKSLNERDAKVFKMDIVDEQIDVASRGILGLTVSCARCHDHKFDPIATTDYYAMAGFFTSTETYYGTPKGKGNRQPSQLMPIGDDSYDKAEALREHREEIAEMTRELGQAKKEMSGLKSKVKDKTELAAATREARDGMRELEEAIRETKKRGPEEPDYAMGVADEEEPADTHVLLRGDVEAIGEVVPRGFLTVMKSAEDTVIDRFRSGREQLAEWMVDARNPLAARVMVNRIWYHLFGSGIVGTVDNFGTQGEKPSHPELLDHLALRFMADGWSVKKMVRYIVTSRAYQMSSAHNGRNYEADPDNRLVWRMNGRRLDSEAIRDAVLAASGQLELAPVERSIVADMSGESIDRDQKAMQRLRNANGNQRSVYLPIVRNAVPEFLSAFDFAEPSILVGQRNVTTVPTQALYLMNSAFILEQSEMLAKRVLEAGIEGREKQIERLFLHTFARPPSAEEGESAARFVDEILAGFAEEQKDPDEADVAAWASLSQALLASAEFRYLN